MFLPLHTTLLFSDGGGEHIDPRQTDVLATTGSQPAGLYLVLVTITATDLDDSKAKIEIQHRDCTDDEANPVESVVVAVPVDNSAQFEFAFKLKQDEIIAVVPYADLIGTITVAINWQRGQ
jgi:hypothetical protein